MLDENYDPELFDGMVDFDLDQVLPDDDSISQIQSIENWLVEPFSCPIDCNNWTDVPLIRTEWFIYDSLTKRHRSPRLFEFLILLLSKSHYEMYASFMDRSKGLFQIHQPEKVAELWQAVKSRQSNQKMTYDKFARAIRWYYKSNIMQKTNTRYTFQFSSSTLKNHFADENNNSIVDLAL